MDCFIYKYEEMSEKEKENYQKKIGEFANIVAEGYIKSKRLLIITGSGISLDVVPDMKNILEHLKELINAKDWEKSESFKKIYNDFINRRNFEKHDLESQLLTYIQNAYLKKNKYVEPEDREPLTEIWAEIVEWLLKGDDKNNKGLLKASYTENHIQIKEMYKKMNALSITTNFDNLLSKAYEDEHNFYPLLDDEAFDKYFISDVSDNSYIEIQSRGDAFWIECTGENNKTCPNQNRHCYVPRRYIDEEIKCKLCGSDAKVYFAFPGTKEKDLEMAKVFEGVWKYIANTISSIIITGNSMDYDPVLKEFVRELNIRRKIPVLYISSYKKNKDICTIKEKAATRMLFADYENTINIWARAEKTEEILNDLIVKFDICVKKIDRKKYTRSDIDLLKERYKKFTNSVFEENDITNELLVLDRKYCILSLFKNTPIFNNMKHISQLGLKTYWLRGDVDDYQKHNRYNHSIGVMSIASYIYLNVCKQPNENEFLFLQIATLLHDIGHLPFSHMLEEIFDEFGWISSGENESFNHEQYTKTIIENMFKSDKKLSAKLKEINYTIDDVQNLINGEFGKGYLDALVNSPLDCDKIEYLFADSIFMGRGTDKDYEYFIEKFTKDLSINENEFLVLKNKSTKSFLDLIKMRHDMYDQVYLRRGLRFLESCCKLIIKTFAVYKCTENDVLGTILDKNKFNMYHNFSDAKIRSIIDFMAAAMNKVDADKICELCVLKEMYEYLQQVSVLSNGMKKTLDYCYKIVNETKDEESVSNIENERINTFEIIGTTNKKRLMKMIKNIYLRFPGIILIDYVESKATFSFGIKELKKTRNDGTRSIPENILIKDINSSNNNLQCLRDATHNINHEFKYSQKSFINLYRITDDLFSYMRAEDYLIHILKREGLIDEN